MLWHCLPWYGMLWYGKVCRGFVWYVMVVDNMPNKFCLCSKLNFHKSGCTGCLLAALAAGAWPPLLVYGQLKNRILVYRYTDILVYGQLKNSILVYCYTIIYGQLKSLLLFYQNRQSAFHRFIIESTPTIINQPRSGLVI